MKQSDQFTIKGDRIEDILEERKEPRQQGQVQRIQHTFLMNVWSQAAHSVPSVSANVR